MTDTDFTRIAQARNEILQNISLTSQSPLAASNVTLIAVSKVQSTERIEAGLATGQRVFGENRVQEAQERWAERRSAYPDLCLHLIGPLQTNKAEDAVALFDVIETIDRPKLAKAIAKGMVKTGKRPQLLIQVNTGEEDQKAGVLPLDLPELLTVCAELDLPISGLMCIPPIEEPAGPHFALLGKLAKAHNLQTLSMGMSADYETAIKFGATHVRVGSGFFGNRSA